MTHSSKELLANGVKPHVVGWRRWRRERGLTIRSMACMLGVNENTLYRYENGDAGARADRRMSKRIEAFVERWEKVPTAREALETEVRRSKLRYRAAALARCRARGFNVPKETDHHDTVATVARDTRDLADRASHQLVARAAHAK